MQHNEQVIRDEAKNFYDTKIKNSRNQKAINDFSEVKSRLLDFYSAEFKAIFLDEIQFQLLNFLKEHRDTLHGGLTDPTCHIEIKTEKILFYLQQELSTLPTVIHQNINKSVQKREKIFVSYSHFDKEFLVDLKRHFKPFLKKVDFWDDTKITPGQKWKQEISKAISETKVAILLISTDFLGSDFIASNELPPLLKAAEESGAVILPVILKPVLFEEFDELNQYQAFNAPSNPIIKMESTEKEDLWVNLVRQTLKILKNENAGNNN